MGTVTLSRIIAGIAFRAEALSDAGPAVIDKLAETARLAELGTGTAASKADKIFLDARTLAASANEDPDLAGALTDPFGVAVVFAKVKAILIRAAAGNTNSVVVKPAAATGFLGPFGAATHTITIPPGGAMLLAAPVGGWAVAAGSADLINIANSGAGTGVTYTITVLGTSA